MAIILFLGAIAVVLWLVVIAHMETNSLWILAFSLGIVALLLQLVGPAFRLLGLVP